MIRRTHNILQWIFGLFLLYLLISRLLISWVQFFPSHFVSSIESISGAQVQVEKITVSQDWLGFDFLAENLSVDTAEYLFQAQKLSFDFNTFYFAFPTLDYGDALYIEEGAYQQKTAQNPEDRIVETDLNTLNDMLRLDINVNRLWKKVFLKEFVVSEISPGLTIQFHQLNALKSTRLSLVTEFSLSYQDILNYERFNFKSFFTPDVWGNVDSGEFSLSSFKPLKIERIRQLSSDNWKAVLPSGELVIDLKGAFKDSLLEVIRLDLNSQMLSWKQTQSGLPENMGLSINWHQGENRQADSITDWQFSLSEVQLDNRYVESISPVKLAFEGNEYVRFSAKRFDLEPFQVLVKALVETQLASNAFDRAVSFSVSNFSGKLDWRTLEVPELAIGFDRLDLPVTDYPGMSMRNLSINKTPHTLSVSSPNPVWLMVPEINNKPIRLDVPELLDLHYNETLRTWSQSDLEFKLNDIPFNVDLTQVNEEYIDADLSVSFKNMAQLKQYLPFPLMSDQLKVWLENGLVSSDEIKVVAKMNGRYRDFPYIENKGLFKVDAKVKNAVLNFNSKWPLLRSFDADVSFSPYKVEVKVPQVDIGEGNVAKNVTVIIPDVDQSDIGVTVIGSVKTTLDKSLRYLKRSPIAEKMGIAGFLDSNVQFLGGSEVFIDQVWVPVSGYEEKEEQVKGRVVLDKAMIDLFEVVEFSDLRGTLNFTESEIKANNLKFKLNQGHGVLDISTDAKSKKVQLKAKGELFVSENQWFEKPMPWQSILEVPFKSSADKGVRYNGTFDFAKAESKLPAPLDAEADLKSPLKISAGIKDDILTAEAGIEDVLKTKLKWRKNKDRYSLAAIKAFIGEESSNKIDESFHSYIRGDLKKLNLGEWLDVYALAPEFGLDASKESALEWKESRIAIKDLEYLGNSYKYVMVSWQKNPEQTVVINVDSKSILGRLDFRSDGEIDAAIEYIKIDTGKYSGQDVSNDNKQCLPQSNKKPLPKINFFGKNVVLGDRKIESLSFKLRQQDDVMVAEDIIGFFGGQAAEIKGRYRYSEAENLSRLNLNLNSRKVSKVAEFFELNQGFSGKKGVVDASIFWEGGVECYQLDSVEGGIKFKLENGAIDDIEPGIARLIGLLSIESLVRRLKLDLKDVTNKGLVYDEIKGSANFDKGILNLSELKLKSPSAKGEIKGAVDTNNETFDLEAKITPKIGATVPTIAALAGNANPLVALAIYSVMKVIPGINENLVTYEYDVTGSWDKPKIKLKDSNEKAKEAGEDFGSSDGSILDQE